MMERSDGVDHDHPPLPLDMKGGSTVPIGGEVGQDLVLILAATVKVLIVVTAMQENITKNQNEKAKVKVVKNGADHPAKGKANIKAAAVVTVGKIRRRKRSRNEVIDRKGIDHPLHRHHHLKAVGMMIQM